VAYSSSGRHTFSSQISVYLEIREERKRTGFPDKSGSLVTADRHPIVSQKAGLNGGRSHFADGPDILPGSSYKEQ
jgi:hypothetical protein